jgi:hypothetical protein
LGSFYNSAAGDEDFDDDDEAMIVFGENSLTVGEKASPAADTALGNVAAANSAPTSAANLTPPPLAVEFTKEALQKITNDALKKCSRKRSCQ